MKTADHQLILELIEDSETRLTPRDLVKLASPGSGSGPAGIRRALRELAERQEIAYTYFFGSTYVEKSFSKPVRVTDHFILRPPDSCFAPGPSDIDILIEPGVSFGSGSHPTTRLCLEAIEASGHGLSLLKPGAPLRAADVGCGSGVLAIAAMKLYSGHCSACDLDPNSVAETLRNVRLNGLENAITVSDEPFAAPDHPLDLICANLRFPTLKTLAPRFRSGLLSPGGILILSGIRSWELDGLCAAYADIGFSCQWSKTLKNWSGVILRSQ